MYNFNTTITNEGAALLARIIANQENAAFKEARLSETNYVGQEATLTAGTFGGVKYTDPTIAASVIDSTTIKVAFDCRGSSLIGAYNLYSIGIIIDDNGTDVLVAVCTSSDPLPIGEEFNDRYAFNVNLSVSSTSNITVTGTSAAVVYDTDVVDNLISTATNKPLSANQGRLIADNLAANEENGAKNILPYPYEETTKTENGVTFTDNGDGTISVVASSGATADTYYGLHYPYKPLYVEKGTYILSGCPTGGSESTYFLSSSYSNDTGDGITVTESLGDNRVFLIVIKSGTVISTPITFKPMLRDARILDNTFVPYAETNLQLTRKTSGLSNENLVDNGWFTVNQRGATTITSGYGADRWKMVDGSSATFSSSGVTMIAQLNNYFENQLPNGVYTASIKYADGTIESGTLTKSNDTDTIRFIQRVGLTLGYAAASKFFYIYTDVSTSIRAVKLELGSISTLANDVEPNYTTELLKCQRYFYRLKANASNAWVCIGVTSGTTKFNGVINLPVPMRATPTVTYSGGLDVQEYGSGVVGHQSSIAWVFRIDTIVGVEVTVSETFSGAKPALLYMPSGSSYIDFSADL